MSDCAWSLFIFPEGYVPNCFHGKTIVLIKLIPNYPVITRDDIFIKLKIIGFDVDNMSAIHWQYDCDDYGIGNIRGGCGSCWDYFANHSRSKFSDLFRGLPKTFDLDKISKLDHVLILDKNCNVMNNFQVESEQTKSGATCNKCNDYNPYAEIPLDGKFYCYKCRKGY